VFSAIEDFNPADLLDLVALGTVADLVPLDRNNRVLVAQGLRRIRAGRCVPGIRALLESGGAAARAGSPPRPGIRCGAAPECRRAAHRHEHRHRLPARRRSRGGAALAVQLSALNDERREIEQRMQGEAVDRRGTATSTDGAESLGLCLFDEAGIRASSGWWRAESRIACIVRWSPSRAPRTAAARFGALHRGRAHSRRPADTSPRATPGLLAKFGGHAMAAGLTLRESSWSDVLGFRAMEINQIKRFIKDLEERTELLEEVSLITTTSTSAAGSNRELEQPGIWDNPNARRSSGRSAPSSRQVVGGLDRLTAACAMRRAAGTGRRRGDESARWKSRRTSTAWLEVERLEFQRMFPARWIRTAPSWTSRPAPAAPRPRTGRRCCCACT
jgi:hypothetical protein